jgi:hypothetical protein
MVVLGCLVRFFNDTIVNGGGSNDDFIEIIWHDGGWIYRSIGS